MKALTLTQPWATLVILGIKKWETRSWYTTAPGRVAIHAAKGWSAEDREFAARLRADGVLPADADLPLGAVLGTVRVDGMVRAATATSQGYISDLEATLGDYTPGRYAWELGDPKPFPEPVPARGMLGLWEWCPCCAGRSA